jgi:alginate O-acetyltransferase complex protein AlgI
MLFNSISYVCFLPTVFVLYWWTKADLARQNALLLLSSYFFYACWDWRFLGLLVFSTLLNFYTGIKISRTTNPRVKKKWFVLSLFTNLSFLGYFKYFNFFEASFAAALSTIGFHTNPWALKIILPVGISFYTFHGLSYVIDIYQNKIREERNFIKYSLFVSFFPLLIAGPIERATHLLPQIQKIRVFNYDKSVDGLRQILWGLFKKIVIADQSAEIVNAIFANPAHYSGSNLYLGAILFAFQIYGDFSGYSDIALGTARLFGIDLLRNFAFPYFSRDIAEFWRRWHISLSSWFRDYLYIPLGGSKGGTWMKVRNTCIIFLVSGFWHGANWTFVAWGFLNALYIMPSIVFNTNRQNLDIVAKGKYLPNFKEFISILITFNLTVFAWILFRAKNLSNALEFIKGICSESLFLKPTQLPQTLLALLLLFILIEWLGREQQFAIAKLTLKWTPVMRYVFYISLICALFWFGSKEQQFIYFDF